MAETIFTYQATVSETVANSYSRPLETVYYGDDKAEAENQLYNRYLRLYRLHKNKIRNRRSCRCLSKEPFLHAIYFSGVQIQFYDTDNGTPHRINFSITASMHIQKIYEPNDRDDVADKDMQSRFYPNIPKRNKNDGCEFV